MGQNFSCTVPAAGCTMSMGEGGGVAADGFACTTDKNAFIATGENIKLEADDAFGAHSGLAASLVGNTGVVIGSPVNISHGAGNEIQLYAGSAVSAAIGEAGGPGTGGEPPVPAEVNAGKKAKNRNAINSGIKGAASIGTAIHDFTGADGAYEKGKAVYDAAKGGWSVAKSGWGVAKAHGAENKQLDNAITYVDAGLAVVDVGVSGGDIFTAEGGVDKLIESAGAVGSVVDAGFELADAVAAAKGESEQGSDGGNTEGSGGSTDIHAVTPTDLRREVGADMKAEVGGDKTSDVDGSIKYSAGNSIEMKAFNKVETSSLVFSAHANISAKMVGLAKAKVEAIGSATVEGRAKVTVKTAGKGKFEAGGKLDIKAGAVLALDAKGLLKADSAVAVVLKAPNVGLAGKSQISIKSAKIDIKGPLTSHKKVTIKGDTLIKKNLDVDGSIQTKAVLSNRYFKCG